GRGDPVLQRGGKVRAGGGGGSAGGDLRGADGGGQPGAAVRVAGVGGGDALAAGGGGGARAWGGGGGGWEAGGGGGGGGVGWVCWSTVMLVVGWRRNRGEGGVWPDYVDPRVAIGPLLLAVAYAVMAYRKVSLLGKNPRTAEKITRYGTLWLSLYACAWLL